MAMDCPYTGAGNTLTYWFKNLSMRNYGMSMVSLVMLWYVFKVLDNLCFSFFSKPFTNDFPRANIHELLAPDLLHQIIKGSFKDHLVDWVEAYLQLTHGASRAAEILDDVDRR